MDSIGFWVLVAVGGWLVWYSTRHKRRPKIGGGRIGFVVVEAKAPPSNTGKLILTLLGFGVLVWWGYYVYGTHCHGAC